MQSLNTVTSMDVADFDGDGRMDLVLGQAPRSFVTILSVSGGRIGLPTFVETGAFDSVWVDVAEIDGSGGPDVIVIPTSSTLEDRPLVFMINDGAGRLEPAHTVPNRARQTDILIGADGTRFLAHADTEERLALTPLSDDGAPGPTSVLADEPTSHVVVLDANGDGIDDLVSGLALEPMRLRVALGDGTFAPPVDLGIVATFGSRITVADVDEDGRNDLLIPSGNTWDTYVRMLLQDPAGGFRGDPMSLPSMTESFVRALHVADVDGDGAIDVVAPSFEGIDVWRGDGRGVFSFGVTLPFESESPYIGSSVGDLDGDGLADIATGSRQRGAFDGVEGLVAVTYGRPGALPGTMRPGGNETFGDVSVQADDEPGMERVGRTGMGIELLDWDPDARTMDVVDAVFFESFPTWVAPAAEPGRVIVGTVDKESDALIYSVGFADGAFTTVDLLFERDEAIDDLVEGDRDGDGDLDLALFVADSNRLEIYERDGGDLTLRQVVEPPFGSGDALQMADLDGDGLAEVVLGGGPTVSVVTARPNTVIGLLRSAPVDVADSTLTVVDWDGDGRLELLNLGPDESALTTYDERELLTTYPVIDGLIPFEFERAFTVADIDGTGPPDVVGLIDSAEPFQPDRMVVGVGVGPVTAPSFDVRISPRLLDGVLEAWSIDLDGDGREDPVVERLGFEAVVFEAGICREPCLGDLDANHAIDFADLVRWLACGPVDFLPDLWTPSGVWDLDGDGLRSLDDLMVLLANWGACGD